jgi:hypothetical protein
MIVMVETTRTDSLDWAGRPADWTGAGTRRCLTTHRTVFAVLIGTVRAPVTCRFLEHTEQYCTVRHFDDSVYPCWLHTVNANFGRIKNASPRGVTSPPPRHGFDELFPVLTPQAITREWFVSLEAGEETLQGSFKR